VRLAKCHRLIGPLVPLATAAAGLKVSWPEIINEILILQPGLIESRNTTSAAENIPAAAGAALLTRRLGATCCLLHHFLAIDSGVAIRLIWLQWRRLRHLWRWPLQLCSCSVSYAALAL